MRATLSYNLETWRKKGARTYHVYISIKHIHLAMRFKKNRGWRKHSREHALAARGISTRNWLQKRRMKADGVSTMKSIIQFPSQEIDYDNFEEMFTAFWYASRTGDFSNFDFDQAFKSARKVFHHRLALNGAFGGEEFLAAMEEELGHKVESAKDLAFANVSEIAIVWRLEEWTGEEYDGRSLSREETRYLADWVASRVWRIAGELPEWQRIIETYEELQDPPEDRRGKIFLMDRAIDTIHVTGSIWPGIEDVGILRNRFDRLAARELI